MNFTGRRFVPTHPHIVELDRIGDEIAELSAHLDAATARLLDLIREFDARGGWNNGFLSCAHWLCYRVGLEMRAARERVRVARALGTLPRLAQALARGELSYSKVRALTRIATPEGTVNYRYDALGRLERTFTGTDDDPIDDPTVAEPAWSPDGTRLAFTRTPDWRTCEIYVARADGTGQQNVLQNSGVQLDASAPGWSSDGRHLLYAASTNPPADATPFFRQKSPRPSGAPAGP